ncbi:MAG: hypothetical protein ABJB12_03465 [Pseudomonadota bacterium]
MHRALPTPSVPLAGAASVASAVCAPHTAAAAAPKLKSAPGVPAPLATHLGLWLADEQHAILSANPEPGWAEGTPSYAGENTALRAVALGRLPKALRAWLGRPVRVLGARGVVCETRLQRFALRAQVTPDPATAEAWDGCADPPLAPAAIAQQIWSLTSRSGRQLVAEFAAPCKGALLALDPDLPAPAVALPEPASAELGERALAEFRKLPAYAEIQARFQSARSEAEGAWDDREVRRSVWSLRLPAHVPLVFVSEEVGPGCTASAAAFSASLSALWADNGASVPLALLLVPPSLDDRRLTPRAVLDLESDGTPAVLLGPDGRFAAHALLAKGKASSSFSKVLLSSVPFFGGPC